MRAGIDVGGTHTDAVILDGQTLLAATKAPTSDDIQTGIISALEEVIRQASITPDQLRMVTIGTTQFTNAVVERRHLAPVVAFRIGAQSSSAMQIAALWPDDIKNKILSKSIMLDGGSEYDGSDIVPLDTAGLASHLENGLEGEAVAITSVFSTSNPAVENEVAARIAERVGHTRIALSNELGGLGLHQRENATLLNASLLPLAEKVTTAFEAAFGEIGLACPFFISQNDGTLMTSAFARRYPVLTFSSGPTNSMRGAAFLSQRQDAMVVDVGGTTSDIGMLINGFPRPSGSYVSIGGVRTNFRMPDTIAVALGGGSVVDDLGQKVGPESVGYRLSAEGMVFGGKTMTSTDIAVAEGLCDIGDKSAVSDIPADVRGSAMQQMRTALERNIDRMKTSSDPLPLIVVGGGAFLVPNDLAGVSETIRPENAGVANAIGATLAQVGGEAEIVYTSSTQERSDALDAAKSSARQKVVDAGADAQSVTIAEITETPMSYMDEPGAVIRVKAIGDVDLDRFSNGANR